MFAGASWGSFICALTRSPGSVQADLKDIVGLVPEHDSKANFAVQ